MDGRGRWIDNRMIERLWRSLKYECVYLRAFETGSEAKKEIGFILFTLLAGQNTGTTSATQSVRHQHSAITHWDGFRGGAFQQRARSIDFRYHDTINLAITRNN
jgi:hypothetical protein